MDYGSEDVLQLSGLQHFAFCKRQWALIHLEDSWFENGLTAAGRIFHQRAHDAQQRERRGELLILRGVPIFSARLGLSGQCDVVEFRLDPQGINLAGEEGLWRPYPVEYKRGSPLSQRSDEMQLCAQAICLEEMLCCPIPEGAIFYGQPRRRTPISFSEPLRQRVVELVTEMHKLRRQGHTPRIKPRPTCRSCSLKELCLPALEKRPKASTYLRRAWEE